MVPPNPTEIPDNMGIIAMTKRKAKTDLVKGDSGKLLREPAFSLAHDKGIKDNLAQNGGNKLAAKKSKGTPAAAIGGGLFGPIGGGVGGAIEGARVGQAGAGAARGFGGGLGGGVLGAMPGVMMGSPGLARLGGGVGSGAGAHMATAKYRDPEVLARHAARQQGMKEMENKQLAKSSSLQVGAARAYISKIASAAQDPHASPQMRVKVAKFRRALDRINTKRSAG